MKSFTDLEQSKMLAKILPAKSADMWWNIDFTNYPSIEENIGLYKESKVDIPCWSLTALLDIIPEGVMENYYAPNIQKENGKYTIAYGNDNLLCIADNPVDACYKMILKLHELRML